MRILILTRKQSMPALWKLMNPQGNVRNLLFRETTRITSGFNSLTHYNFGAQIYSHASSDENTRGKSCSEQRMEGGENPNMEFGENEQQARCFLEAQKEKKESPLRYIDGQLSSQEFRVGTKAPKIQKDESCSDETW